MADDEGKSREDFTWDDAVRTLAMCTSLDWRAAHEILYPLETADPPVGHPYDVVPLLMEILAAHSEKEWGRPLLALLRIAQAAATDVR